MPHPHGPQSRSPHTRSSHVHAAKKPKTQPRNKPPPVFQPPAATAARPVMSRDLLPLKTARSASMAGSPSERQGERPASASGKKRPREDEDVASRRTRSAGGDTPRSGSEGGSGAKGEAAFQRQLIAVFVPRALKESAEGQMSNYNDLVAHFLPKPLEPANGIALPPLLPLLRALTAHVSLLRPELHRALVTAILALPWATGDDRFVKTYVGWAGVLVSAHPGWAKEVVTMVVKGFRWQPCFPPSPQGITRRIFHARHHFLLAHLLSLIPTLPTVLQNVLQKNGPHKREVEVVQTTWVRNCTDMIEYCPELGAHVWSALVDKMLRIDVEITNSVEDDDDEDDDEEDEYEEVNEEVEEVEEGDEGVAVEHVPEPVLRLPRPAAVDPFNLLISEDVLQEGAEDDDDDSDDDDVDPDIDALSTDEELESETEQIIDRAKAAEKARAARRQKRENLRLLRGKLDGMMTYFFCHLSQCMGKQPRGPTVAELGAKVFPSRPPSVQSTPEGSRATSPSSSWADMDPFVATRPPPTEVESLSHFQTLVNLFARQILPTSATQHIPFIMFYCSAMSPAHCEMFLHLIVLTALYARTNDEQTMASQPVPQQQRIAATVYIGSIVCRARFVTDDQARTVTQYLLAWVEGKMRQSKHKSLAALDELPLFYAVCQALMVIFCFRWRAFRHLAIDDSVLGDLEMDDVPAISDEWMRDLDTLQRALTSDLNPLLGCNPTVVNTFAKVAHATGFAYCFSIIEANQQAAARSSSSNVIPAENNGGLTTKGRPRRPPSAAARQNHTHALQVPRKARQANIDAGLDGYFPFDPYDLPRSHAYVELSYRTWADVAVDLPEDEEEYDEEYDEEYGEYDEYDEEYGEEGEYDEGEEEYDEEMADDGDAEELAEGRLSIPKVTHEIPRPPPSNGSYGNRRRDMLRDGVLSTSLETMSISPNISAT